MHTPEPLNAKQEKGRERHATNSKTNDQRKQLGDSTKLLAGTLNQQDRLGGSVQAINSNTGDVCDEGGGRSQQPINPATEVDVVSEVK